MVQRGAEILRGMVDHLSEIVSRCTQAGLHTRWEREIIADAIIDRTFVLIWTIVVSPKRFIGKVI